MKWKEERESGREEGHSKEEVNFRMKQTKVDQRGSFIGRKKLSEFSAMDGRNNVRSNRRSCVKVTRRSRSP